MKTDVTFYDNSTEFQSKLVIKYFIYLNTISDTFFQRRTAFRGISKSHYIMMSNKRTRS